MHEFAIAEGLVKIAQEELRKLGDPPPKPLAVHIAAGALNQIVKESLDLAFETLTADTPLAGACLVLRLIPAGGVCAKCGWEGSFPKPPFFCPKCESARVTLTSGRELYLESLEIEDVLTVDQTGSVL